jgi:hypothetical protein
MAGYLDLLDWTGRQIVPDKRGAIPARLAPIVERGGIPTETWLELSLGFGKLFHRVAGCPVRPSLTRFSARMPRKLAGPMFAPDWE